MSDEITQKLSNNDFKLILDRLDSIDSRLGSLETRLEAVETRLTTLEEKVDRRLQETRPIWEQVLARINGLESAQQEFRTEVRQSFRTLEADGQTRSGTGAVTYFAERPSDCGLFE